MIAFFCCIAEQRFIKQTTRNKTKNQRNKRKKVNKKILKQN